MRVEITSKWVYSEREAIQSRRHAEASAQKVERERRDAIVQATRENSLVIVDEACDGNRECVRLRD